MPQYKLRKLAYNKLTLVGGAVAVVAFFVAAFFLVAQGASGQINPYMGILTYMVLPPFIVLGLILIPVGMARQARRFRQEGEAIPPWPMIDFNRASHRRAFLFFLVTTLILGCFGAVASYQTYHYTESVVFCGKTCHSVMKPEYTAYQSSSHARVPCTACHVGAGASWYVRSKLSGAYQVYATAFDLYPRPIETPISNLRPAQQTCETCHWPEKFFGAQQRQFNHYMYDEKNTHWPINMLIKTGGGDPETGQKAGIHWHMNIAVKVEYIARDARRQDIPWIRVTDRQTGRVTIYQDKDNPLTKQQIDTMQKWRMDCMDCHNRPSHKFLSPDYSVDQALLTGAIDPDLPEIKRASVEAMNQSYANEDEAMRGIAAYISDFYHDHHPEVFQTRRSSIDRAILAVQRQYSKSIFPGMKVRWDEYPDNIGHFIYPGCFRCHSGNKVSKDGWVIPRDCTTCHVILSQGTGARTEVASTPEGLVFDHPDQDVGDAWRDTNCYECHSGVQP